MLKTEKVKRKTGAVDKALIGLAGQWLGPNH
jgi:hypothetical protein